MEDKANLSNLPGGVRLDAVLPDRAEALLWVASLYMAEQPADPFEALLERERSEAIDRAMKVLSPKQRAAIRKYHGFEGNDDGSSFREIGDEEGLTQEAIRRRYQEGMRQLRDRPVARKLEDLL
jgi:RNA polymerase sigma factor (sigma-70 family)